MRAGSDGVRGPGQPCLVPERSAPVLAVLRQRGWSTPEEVAIALGIEARSVRLEIQPGIGRARGYVQRYLALLESEGKVERERVGTGRPRYRWRAVGGGS